MATDASLKRDSNTKEMYNLLWIDNMKCEKEFMDFRVAVLVIYII